MRYAEIVPARAIFWRVLGWIFSRLPACFESSRGSQPESACRCIAPGVAECKVCGLDRGDCNGIAIVLTMLYSKTEESLRNFLGWTARVGMPPHNESWPG
jgi:hypothetical protein